MQWGQTPFDDLYAALGGGMRGYMKIKHDTLSDLSLSYPLGQIAPLESILLLDIETTGFTANSSYLYLIGCAYYAEGAWRTTQWLAESYAEEKDLLDAFLAFADPYDCLIHYNGNQFDLPFLMQKCEQLNIPHELQTYQGVDLYKRIAPCKDFLALPNCKQKTLESFLGYEREDVFSGGELIGIYHEYVKNPSDFAENSLFLHNLDDLKGMLRILPILSYSDLISDATSLRAKKVQANSYRDLQGNVRRELLITIALPNTLPKPVSLSANNCFFRGEGNEATIRVPVFDGELKYFYANYKDYYYLPEEDIALHKSVASFVDKEHRTQAAASNCYTRKVSSYLPQWSGAFTPYFKQDYQSKELYFELTDAFKKDRAAFARYAEEIFRMLAKSR